MEYLSIKKLSTDFGCCQTKAICWCFWDCFQITGE